MSIPGDTEKPEEEPEEEALPEKPQGVDPEKLRQSITQTYKDFLQYKRSILTDERLQEFQGIGRDIPRPDRGFHSFAGEAIDFREVPPDETASFAYGDSFDRTLDLSALLCPHCPSAKLFDEPEKCELCEDDRERDQFQKKMDYLIEDQYYPGLLDDAVHKKVDFYKVSFDTSFGPDGLPPDEEPENAPLSLVEAFDKRVAKEQGARKKIMKEAPPQVVVDQKDTEQAGKSFLTFLKDYKSPTRLINRDEVALANTVDVELATLVRNKPVNELTQAINCLQKAEIMNEYDKSLQAAEEAYSSAPPELAESAAVQKATTFMTEEISKKTATVGGGRSYRPIEIVSYMGITKPVGELDLDETRKEDEFPAKPVDVAPRKKAGEEKRKAPKVVVPVRAGIKPTVPATPARTPAARTAAARTPGARTAVPPTPAPRTPSARSSAVRTAATPQVAAAMGAGVLAKTPRQIRPAGAPRIPVKAAGTGVSRPQGAGLPRASGAARAAGAVAATPRVATRPSKARIKPPGRQA